MVLVDTSIWIKHLRKTEPQLVELLDQALVLMHPLILGELACGSLNNRTGILGHLGALPAAVSASDEETLGLIEDRRLWGRGIGWIDAHLVASALLANCRLWTADERLRRVCEDVGVNFAGVV